MWFAIIFFPPVPVTGNLADSGWCKILGFRVRELENPQTSIDGHILGARNISLLFWASGSGDCLSLQHYLAHPDWYKYQTKRWYLNYSLSPATKYLCTKSLDICKCKFHHLWYRINHSSLVTGFFFFGIQYLWKCLKNVKHVQIYASSIINNTELVYSPLYNPNPKKKTLGKLWKL